MPAARIAYIDLGHETGRGPQDRLRRLRRRLQPAAHVNLLDRRLLFVTGKGGVGKTSVAAGLALLAAGEGKRTLLCEVDAKGDIAAAFESGPLRYRAHRGRR